jgi:hypothetical protein
MQKIDEIQMYSDVSGGSSTTLLVPEFALNSLIEMVGRQIIELYCPQSPGYIAPDNAVIDLRVIDFTRAGIHNDIFQKVLTSDGFFHFGGETHYPGSVTASLELLVLYARKVNRENGQSTHHGFLAAKVTTYLALGYYHSYIVARIKHEHRSYGDKRFGCQCDYQKNNLFNEVKDWYERYAFDKIIKTPFPDIPLPQDEPGYYDE